MRTHVKREERSSRFSRLWREQGEVELAQALGVPDDIDLGDSSVCEREAEYAEERFSGRYHETDCAVDERRLCGTSTTRGAVLGQRKVAGARSGAVIVPPARLQAGRAM
jgi:hypothetical protein